MCFCTVTTSYKKINSRKCSVDKKNCLGLHSFPHSFTPYTAGILFVLYVMENHNAAWILCCTLRRSKRLGSWDSPLYVIEKHKAAAILCFMFWRSIMQLGFSTVCYAEAEGSCCGESQCILNMLWIGITQPVFSAVCSITKPAFSPVVIEASASS
jgi:hypothetical protein